MTEQIDGNGRGESVRPNAHEASGEAALLLVESLIHGLVARSGLSLTEAIEIVQIALDTQEVISEDRGEPETGRPGVLYLSAIAASLRIDEEAARDGQEFHPANDPGTPL